MTRLRICGLYLECDSSKLCKHYIMYIITSDNYVRMSKHNQFHVCDWFAVLGPWNFWWTDLIPEFGIKM
jgi:hypothetical protein